MRVFVTGGLGFIGSRVVSLLAEHGGRVTTVVRAPDRLAARQASVDRVAGDLRSSRELEAQIAGHEAVIHIAGMYRVGIPPAERPAMWDANVGTTERVLDAAAAAGAGRIVYVSTVNVFGNTRGRVVDETYRRDPQDGFLSWYDETKFRAHEAAERRLGAGLPISIAMPSQVYGSNDHSSFGEQLRLAHDGKLPYRALDDVGVGLVHVDDLAAGIVAVLDVGRVGESYVLSGPRTTLRDAIGVAAMIGGRRPPRLRVPTTLLRAMAPAGRLIGQPNLREVISAAAGVTYWASSAKAERELGFAARDLAEGFGDTFGRP
jgi:dihydroflavonol-4-reductase